jgi:hypothetical protein
MWPPSTATVVIATTNGSCVAVNSANASRSCRSGSTRRYRSIAGVPRTTRNSTKKIAHLRDAPTLEKSASTSRRMPLTTKKNGMKTPNATAASFESKNGISRARSVCRVIRPAANPPRSRSRPSSEASSASANTSTTIQRTASCELVSMVRSSIGMVRPADRTASTATPTASATNATRISALCSALCVDRTSVSSRIGPNSPTAPAASR